MPSQTSYGCFNHQPQTEDNTMHQPRHTRRAQPPPLEKGGPGGISLPRRVARFALGFAYCWIIFLTAIGLFWTQ